MGHYRRRPPGTDAYAASRALFDALITRMGEPQMRQRPEHTVEEFITGTGRDVLKQVLQDHLDARAAAEQRLAEVPGADEVVRRRAEPGHTRLLGTTLGEVEVTRIAYRAPGVSNLHPGDARLGLPGAVRPCHGICVSRGCVKIDWFDIRSDGTPSDTEHRAGSG